MTLDEIYYAYQDALKYLKLRKTIMDLLGQPAYDIYDKIVTYESKLDNLEELRIIHGKGYTITEI